jgi:DNA-binding beta-propeller fold protein YncE/cytochrome c peroxidase
MRLLESQRHWFGLIVLVSGIILGISSSSSVPHVLAQEGDIGATAFDTPTYSSPIAMDALKNLIWVVNPDDDSISVIGNLNTANPSVLTKINVGDEPVSIALDTNNGDPSKYHAYVANAADNTVTVINVTSSSASAVSAVVQTTLLTGAEPRGIVATPDGTRVFVANSVQDTITVIRTNTTPPSIVGNVNLRTNGTCNPDSNRHFQPRGLAVTQNSSRLYVTRFLSFTGGGSPRQGTDNGKVGLVCHLTIPGNVNNLPTVASAVTLAARDTGFTATVGGVQTATQAYPNQLQSIVIHDGRAYLPNIAASPAGPLRFNVDTQAFVNIIGGVDSGTLSDVGALNLHLAARNPEPGKDRLFFANPWAIAFTGNDAGNAYVVSAGSDLLVKLNVNSSGDLSFTVDGDTTRYIDLNNPGSGATSGANAGKNPLGIVIRNLGPGNNKAFVMNYISRNVSVVNLDNDTVIKVIQTTTLPPAGSEDEQLQVGAEMFFSSRGVFNGGKVNRLSSEGWQNCASCHPDGLTDGVVWIFGAGSRKSVPMNGSWSPHNPDDQRILNYSAIFDEVQDFEANIRNVSGPGPLGNGAQDPNHGLLIGDNGDINGAPGAVNAFALPNAGRPQLSVTLPGSGTAWPALDALKEWVRFAIRTPNGMLTDDEGLSLANGALDDSDVNNGRRLFFQAGCQQCHGGTKWTVSNKDFTSPPAAGDIFTETTPPPTVGDPIGTQYLDRFLFEVGTFNLGVTTPINGQLIGAFEKASTANVTGNAGKDALGIDYNGDGRGPGFNIPSLLGIWSVQPYYHNGSCETLTCVLSNVTHRSAGRNGLDILNTQGERDDVIAFLQSLDADTEFPLNLYIDRHDIFLNPPTVFKGTTVELGANISLFGTKADLTNLINDLGAGSLTVKFTLASDAGSSSQQVSLAAADFNQDFGQATKSVNFNVPANAGNTIVVTVEVDSDKELVETKESDNEGTRRVRVFNPPPDRTPPVVNNVFISDDNPFNDNDQVAQTRNVKVKIVAVDPTSPAPQSTSGLKTFCLVRYAYDVARRRWVEENCNFQPLPAPVAANTFIVDAQLRPKEGVGYVFAWVRDGDGNISSAPGFDFISFIPNNQIRLDRNDSRLFRLRVPSGSLTLTFISSFGDVDVSVFQGFGANAPRCALSANNGRQPETITIPNATPPNTCSGTEFQVEVRAVENSRFSISTVAGASNVGAGSEDVSTQAVTTDQPLVGGAPALRTAIEGGGQQVFVPVVLK